MDNNNDYFKNIDKIYNKVSYFQRNGLDVFITIIIILFMISAIVYFTLLNNLQKIRANWEIERCNPIYMPFVSIINPDPNKTPDQQVSDNINNCISNGIKDSTASATKSFYDRLELFTELKNNFFNSMSFISTLFKALFQAIQTIIAKFLEFLNKIIFGITNLFITMRSIVYQIIGVMAVQIYIFEELFFIAAAWMLNVVTFTAVTTIPPLGYVILGETLVLIIALFYNWWCGGCLSLVIYGILFIIGVTIISLLIVGIVCILLFQVQDGVQEKIKKRQKIKSLLNKSELNKLNKAKNLSNTKL